MLKLIRLTAILSAAIIPFVPYFANPAFAQVPNDENTKVKFTSMFIDMSFERYQPATASGYITNLSNQNISVDRINVVIGSKRLQIVSELYLKPGQTASLGDAPVAGLIPRNSLGYTTIYGRVTDVISWLDENRYGYDSNFTVCLPVWNYYDCQEK